MKRRQDGARRDGIELGEAPMVMKLVAPAGEALAAGDDSWYIGHIARRWTAVALLGFSLLAGGTFLEPVSKPGDSGGCAEDDCGPAPGAPNVECDDGSIRGPSCERDEYEQCAWVIRECPPSEDECTAQQCGPAPAAPNYLCEDGSIGGPGPCVSNDDWVCGWTFRDCPE